MTGRIGRALAILCLLLGVDPVFANAPDTSPRPVARVEAIPPGITLLPTRPLPRPRARPGTAVDAVVGALRQSSLTPVTEQAVARSVRPRARLRDVADTVQPRPSPTRAASPATALAVAGSLRPRLRPANLASRVIRRQTRQVAGSVCNDPAIRGERIGRVPGKISGCSIEDAVRISSVSGVRLSQTATLDCETAKALRRWVENGMALSLRPKGQVVELKVAAGYACRTRNNQPGARISEHGRGRAIDISGFVMNDGEVITVLNHWNKAGYRSEMRRLHRTACGVFGTVLGPESDRFHQNHFHFDTARDRGGPYCR